MTFNPLLCKSQLSNLKDEFTKPALMLLIALLVIAWYNWLIKPYMNKNPPLPPGPRGLPIFGNLPFLDSNLHHCLAELAKTYGPVMKLKLGTRLCIVISSPSVAKEVLNDHDLVFANRDVPAVSVRGSYGCADIVWSPHGDHWRMLRKICVRELLSNMRLESLYGLRRREVRNMVSEVYSKVGEPINIGEQVLLTMFNVMTNMLWGGTLEGEEKNRVRSEFKQVMDKLVRLLAEPNVSDLWPVLSVFDVQGVERKMKKLNQWFDQIFDFVIDKRMKMKSEGKLEDEENKDFLQVLLEFIDHGDHKLPFTTTHIKALFLDYSTTASKITSMILKNQKTAFCQQDIMGAGTKSSSTTVEWAVAELMNQPKLMKKAQEEIEEIVGMNNMVEESHLLKLHYVTAIVKETLRLHPVGPLLIPRAPTESRIIGGYMVPKGCKVMVNAWAVHRDPESWENPLEFRPERFLCSSGEWDFNGNKFSYIPFGGGRRICVGIPMAERMVPYLLSTLLHSFNWKLPEDTKLDLSETFGLELRKTTPLFAFATPRLSDPKLYTSRIQVP